MNPQATRIIKYILERIMERELEVIARPDCIVELSQDVTSPNHEVVLRCTEDINFSINTRTLLGLVEMSAGRRSGEKAIGKRLSSMEFYLASDIATCIWQELSIQQVTRDLVGLNIGITGCAGYMRFSRPIPTPKIISAKEARDESRAYRRAVNPLTELRNFFDSLSYSHKTAQICHNLLALPDLIVGDMLKGETPAVAALILGFLDRARIHSVLQDLDPERRQEILELFADKAATQPTELMLTALAFYTYPPVSTAQGERADGGQEKKHLAAVQ